MSESQRGTALVLGASGDQGAPQVAALRAAGWTVRAAAHTPRDGYFAVDYAQPATLARACAGVDVVLANYPSSSFHARDALLAAAEATGRAAAAAGARLIVFNTSLPLPPQPLGFRAQDVRFEQRAALRASGVPLISIQPVVYMDNLLRGWAYPSLTGRGVFEYPHAPQLEVAWLCLRDLGALMAAAAERPELAGREFNVGGPEILRGADVARTLSAVLGREIAFASQPVEAFCARMRSVFARTATLDADALVGELDRIYRWYNDSPTRPFRVEMAPVLRELPVRLTPLREWATQQDWSRRP